MYVDYRIKLLLIGLRITIYFNILPPCYSQDLLVFSQISSGNYDGMMIVLKESIMHLFTTWFNTL